MFKNNNFLYGIPFLCLFNYKVQGKKKLTLTRIFAERKIKKEEEKFMDEKLWQKRGIFMLFLILIQVCVGEGLKVCFLIVLMKICLICCEGEKFCFKSWVGYS